MSEFSMSPWQKAIDEALIASGLDCTSDDESAQQALARLIAWEKKMALDPAVSREAYELQSDAVEMARWCEGDYYPQALPERRHIARMWCNAIGEKVVGYGPDYWSAVKDAHARVEAERKRVGDDD